MVADGTAPLKRVFGSDGTDFKHPEVDSHIIAVHMRKLRELHESGAAKGLLFKELHDQSSLYQKIKGLIDTQREADGTLPADKFAKIITDIRNETETKYNTQRAELEKDPEGNKDAIKRLDDKHKKLNDVIDDVKQMGEDIRKGGKIFSEKQIERLEATIKIRKDELQALIDSTQQEVLQTQRLHLETIQMARHITKTSHDAKSRILNGIASR